MDPSKESRSTPRGNDTPTAGSLSVTSGRTYPGTVSQDELQSMRLTSHTCKKNNEQVIYLTPTRHCINMETTSLALLQRRYKVVYTVMCMCSLLYFARIANEYIFR